MGHMKQVWAIWGELPDRPFRVLLYMAMRLPDAEESPRWYGSQDELAVAIGDAAAVDGPQRKTVLRRVSTAVAALVDAGALDVLQRAAPGRRPVYELRVSMDQARYSRDRVIRGRPLNARADLTPTVAPNTRQRSRKLRDPMSSEDITRTRTPGETSRNQLADADARGTRLRAIDGGRNNETPDGRPVQLPLLAVVPVQPSEPVTHQRYIEDEVI